MIPRNSSFEVEWGGVNMLSADIKCIMELLSYKENGTTLWWYSVALAGTELPTKSYWKFHEKISSTLKRHESSVKVSHHESEMLAWPTLAQPLLMASLQE